MISEKDIIKIGSNSKEKAVLPPFPINSGIFILYTLIL
jgi:hypothetical protein